MKDMDDVTVTVGELVQFNEEPPNRELHHRVGTLAEDNGDLHGVVEFRDPPRPGAEPAVTRVVALWMEISVVGRPRWPEPKRDVVPDLSFPLGEEPPRRVPSRADMNRLRSMAEALALPAPRRAAQAAGQIRQVGAALAAALMLGDLGSATANRAAAADRERLEARSAATAHLLAAEAPPALAGANQPVQVLGCSIVGGPIAGGHAGRPEDARAQAFQYLGERREEADGPEEGPSEPERQQEECPSTGVAQGRVTAVSPIPAAPMPAAPLGGAGNLERTARAFQNFPDLVHAQEAMRALRVNDNELQSLVHRGELHPAPQPPQRFWRSEVEALRSRFEGEEDVAARHGLDNPCREVVEERRGAFVGRVSDSFFGEPRQACADALRAAAPDMDTYIVEMIAGSGRPGSDNHSPIDVPSVVSGACQDIGARVVSLSGSRGVIVATEDQANDMAMRLRMSCTVRKAR